MARITKLAYFARMMVMTTKAKNAGMDKISKWPKWSKW